MTDQLEFSDLKNLSDQLKRRHRQGKQHGGDATPMPWPEYNPMTAMNTEGVSANNYGQLTAQQVGSPTAGYGWSGSGSVTTQMGGGGKSKSKSKNRKQHGGDATPMPWPEYNPMTAMNTEGVSANNYGQLTAQQVGSPTAGYGWASQMGGKKQSKGKKKNQKGGDLPLWGSNEPTFNKLDVPNYNTIYPTQSGGDCGCGGQNGGDESHGEFTLTDIIDGVQEATGADPTLIHDVTTHIYGDQKVFTQHDLEDIIGGVDTAMTDESEDKNFSLGEVIKELTTQLNVSPDRVNEAITDLYGNAQSFDSKQLAEIMSKLESSPTQTGGDPTPMPWEWYHAGSGPQPLSGPSGNSPTLIGGGRPSKKKTSQRKRR